MTNEEIFKKANEDLKPQEKVYNSICTGTLVLLVFGYKLISIAICLSDSSELGAILLIFTSLIVFLYFMAKYRNRYAKKRRNYIYNLVRKDERTKHEDN